MRKGMRFRRHRLRLTKDIERVLRFGVTRRFYEDRDGRTAEVLTVKCYPHKYPRFAVMVSKKVAKKSVWRNRIKRIVREAVRKLIKEGRFPNCDAVIIVREDLHARKTQDIERMLKEIFPAVS